MRALRTIVTSRTITHASSPLPANEPERPASLQRLRLLDASPEKAFDSPTRLVTSLLEMPMAVVSPVDETRQWFKSAAGLDAGDYLLREVGKRLTACLRDHDTVARLGGDEFIVVPTQLATPQESNEVLERISQALATPITRPNGKSATVDISFGLAHGDERSDAATLIS